MTGGSPWTGRLLVLLGFVFVVYVSINTLRTQGRPATGLPTEQRMPAFAAPLAVSPLEGDVNVATRETVGDAAGARPACEVRGPDVLNGCDLWAEGPAVLAFFFTRGADCAPALDALETARRRFEDVSFAAVAVRGSRDAVRELVRERGWGFPVGFDRDGALANLYAVSGCPHVVLAERGGRITQTLLGNNARTELERAVAALAGR